MLQICYVSVILRSDYIRTDGTSAMYLRVVIDKKNKKYPLHKYINPKEWDSKKASVKTSNKYYAQYNLFISENKTKAENIFLNAQREQRILTFKDFEMLFFEKFNHESFINWASNKITTYTGKYSKETIKGYTTEISKLKKYSNDVSFIDINRKWIEQYEFYMRNKLNNCNNTIHKTFKRIKALLRVAQEEGLISNFPFDGYKIKLDSTKREYLTTEELQILEDMQKENLNAHLKNTLKIFLFSCYTGLRFTDILQIKPENIKTSNNNKYIELVMHKTNENIVIPLIKKAINLLPDPDNANTYIFNVYSNQKMNEYLKIICAAANINKKISFHCARHTFATISLNLGIPIEVVSKLLGHNELKTTQIYAKIVDKTKFVHMDKWDNL